MRVEPRRLFRVSRSDIFARYAIRHSLMDKHAEDVMMFDLKAVIQQYYSTGCRVGDCTLCDLARRPVEGDLSANSRLSSIGNVIPATEEIRCPTQTSQR